MLGSTFPSSIWGRFALGCHSSWGPAEPVFLAIIGGPGPVMSTRIDGRENLFGCGGSWLGVRFPFSLTLPNILGNTKVTDSPCIYPDITPGICLLQAPSVMAFILNFSEG